MAYLCDSPEEATYIDHIRDLTSKLISVTQASKISGLTPGFIRTMIREGVIEGVKIGRNWLTTEVAIREYLKQDRRPGPKPKELKARKPRKK